jgi:hypothetical protein
MKANLTFIKMNCLLAFGIGGILVGARFNTEAADGHWVTTWGTAPQLTEPGNLPPVPLAHSTLRQFVRPSIGGKQIRVRFSNAYGTELRCHQCGAHRARPQHDQRSAMATSLHRRTRGLRFVALPGSSFRAVKSVYLRSDRVRFARAHEHCHQHLFRKHFSHDHQWSSRFAHHVVHSIKQCAFRREPAASEQNQALVYHHRFEVLADSSSKAIVVLGDSLTDGRGATDDGIIAGRTCSRSGWHQCADVRRGGGQPGNRRQRHLWRTRPGGGESV